MSVIVQVSISGGRTSGYMAVWLKNNIRVLANYLDVPIDSIKLVYVFANTGREDNDTLRFLDAIDRNLLDGQVVWLEGVPYHDKKKSTGHRVVTFETAARHSDYMQDGHPFKEFCKKYGVPNISMPPCTRELKMNPIKSYMKEMGYSRSQFYSCVGIRIDETRRVNQKAVEEKILYPLIDLIPTDKEDVLSFWEDYDFDLKIPERWGNCLTCFKKSHKKLNSLYNEAPEIFEFNDYIEREFGFVGAEFEKHGITVPRKCFRENRNTQELIASFRLTEVDPVNYIRKYDDAGCSESCEFYPTE